MFLCNPQKSGVSRVCIAFLQITQKKILTKDIFHWLQLITEILSFLQIFSIKKNNPSAFVIFQKLYQNINKKTLFLANFGTLIANCRQFMGLLTLHCFFLTLITVFSYVQCHISLSVSTIFSFCFFIFTFFFILVSPRDTFYNSQCLI